MDKDVHVIGKMERIEEPRLKDAESWGGKVIKMP